MADFFAPPKNSASPFADSDNQFLPRIGRKLAFCCDTFGNLIELAAVLP